MNSRLLPGLLLLAASGGVSADVTAENLILASDAPGDRIVSPPDGWQADEPVTITVLGSGSEGEAIHAWELSLECDSDRFQIASVELNPAFTVLGNSSATLPERRFHALMVRPREALEEPSQGGPPPQRDGAPEPDWLARVEVQVLNEGPSEAALRVRARGLSPEAWRDAGRREAGRRRAPAPEAALAITLVNAGRAAPVAEPMEYIRAVAVLEIQPVGGGLPLIQLAPGTEYEVHYLSLDGPAEGYTLSVIGRTADPRLEGAWPGGNSEAVSELFDFIEGDPPGAPLGPASEERTGLYRFQMVLDDGLLPSEAEDPSEGVENPYTSYLCNIVTGDAGPLILELVLFRTDWEALATVELRAAGQFEVMGDE